MGFLSLYNAVDRVVVATAEDGSDYWVDLRRHLSRADSRAAEQAILPKSMYEGQAGQDGGKISGQLDSATYREVVVLRAIKDWNLTDESGQAIPISLDGVKTLPVAVFDSLFARVNKSNAARSEKDSTTFRDALDVSAPAEDIRTAGADALSPA